MKYKIPFIKPNFPSVKEMTEDYEAIVASNWYTNFGPFERQLSVNVAKFVGQGTSATTVANATLGLDIAIRALFTKSGNRDEVIMPSFTFAAGADVLLSAGYTPVFIDIKETSWQPDIDQAEEYLHQNTDSVRGILLCNIFGVGNEDIASWEELAKRYSIPLIIDSAAGFGSMYSHGQLLGARGDCEVFSMHATKPFSVGEGGLIVSKSIDLINKTRSLQNFGLSDGTVVAIGTNAKLQEINCAIGSRQLIKLENRLKARRRVLRRYKSKLSSCGFKYQANDETSTVPFLSVVSVSKDEANKVKATLLDSGVEVRSYYSPLHLHPYLQSLSVEFGKLSTTESIAERIISLPVHDDMSNDSVDEITKLIVTVLEQDTNN